MTQSTSFAQVATNQFDYLSNALCANTPPYKKHSSSRKSLTSSISLRLLLVMFLTLTVSASAWGAEVTAAGNIVNGNTYYIKGVRSNNTYYLKFTDSNGSQKGTEASSTNDAIPITFIAVNGGWNLKTPNGNYIAPGTSNGTINVSTNAITVAASNSNSKIRLSIVNNSTTWSIQKNTSAANFGGYKNTQTDITLVDANVSTPVNPTITFSNGSYTVGGAALELSTLWESNSTGSVTYSITNAGTTGATINGTSFTATAAGTCTVQASQAATAAYKAATATATIIVNAPTGGGGSGGCEWQLVTDVDDLEVGDRIVIAAEGYNYALSTTQNNNNRGQASIIKDGNSITFGNDVQILTLEQGSVDGTFAFNTGSGYLYAASSSSNYLRTKTPKDANASWGISITKEGTFVAARGTYTRNVLNYNSSGLFSCYYPTNLQKPIVIYKEVCSTETAVSLAQQGGTGGTTSVTATYGQPMPAITIPTRAGYDFQGYFTANGGTGTKYYNADGTSAKDWDKEDATFTLIAYWTPQTYTVTLNNQGATTAGATSVTATYNAAMPSIASNLPQKTGYTFNGYFDAASGGTQYYNADGTSAKNWDKIAATTLYAQWTCETPVFDIKIKNDNPVIFSGETIELTVVGSNIATDATYQWYKGEDEIVGKTTDKLTIANATADDAGNYKCEVSNATCSAENNYTVKMYHIKGLTDGTWTIPFEFVKSGDKEGTFSVELAANITYYFKLNDGSVWYWNEGTMTHNNCTDWVIEQEGADTQGKANTGITTTASGTYTFTLNYEDPSKPKLSVTYPQKKMVYFNPNMWADGATEVYTVYSWQDGSNGSFVTMTSVEGCGNTNIYQAEIDASHDKLLFIRWNQAHTAWNNNRWNQSIDLDYQTNGQYKIDDWGNNSDLYWKDGAKKSWASYEKTFTPNYTVTFDENGHGTAPDAQCVAKNGKATTPAAPTATGYTFGGWYKEAGCTNAWDFANDVVTEDITLYAKWTANTHTVTWIPAGGNWAGNPDNIVQTYEYGAKINAPEKPTYDCYEFAEWTPAYNAEMTMPDEDLEFTAKWNKLSYTITFQNWDGSELQSSTVECGETPSYTGATPTREQTAQYTYTFSGWSPALYPADKDQEYTAQFNTSTRQYTVTWYDGTGNAHKTQTADYNTTVALPTTNLDPCDDDYPYFIGWTADPIVGSTTTQPTLVENVKVTGDCDYYAVFAKGEAGGGGSYVLDYTAENLGSSNKWGSYGTAYTHTAKDGSTWVIKAHKNSGMQINTGKNASIKIPTCPSPITSIEVTGTTSKAVGLSASDYTGSGTITYIASGTDATNQTLDLSEKSVTGGYIVAKSGSIPITRVIVNFGAQTEYTAFITTCCTSWTAPTLTYTTPLEENGTAVPQFGAGTTHGTVTYASSNPSILSVNSTTGQISAQAPGTATVTATWSGDETYCSVSSTSNVITVKGSFSVIFEANGGTGTMANQKANENNNIAQLNANQFTRTDYAFVGWNTEANGTGIAYADQATDITLTGNLTLYAQWAAIVTLNDAGNVTTTHPETAGGSITLPDGANVCEPYEFVGWTSVATADWNGEIEEPELVTSPYKPTAPITLYAVYKIQSEGNPNAFKLSFEGDNGKTYYVGEYGSSPYLRGFSNITKEEAVTFIRTKMYPNDDTKYYLYLEYKEEYLYCYSSDLYTTSNTPSEAQGWVFHTVGDKIQLQAINQSRYLSFSDRDDETINITTHATGSQESFNMLPAVTSTYVASPLCNQEIEIIFETGNGDFVDNAPATNPLTVSRGDVITLPTCEYPGYEFMGWMKDEQQLDPSDIIGTYYTGDYTVDGVSSTITFYAYYKAVPEEVEFTGTDDAELLMYYYDGTANYYYASSLDGGNGELPSMQNCFNATTWTFTNVGNMQYHIQDETGKYLGAVNDNDNDLSLSNTPKVWNFTLVNGLWKMVCEDSPSRALMYISTGKKFANAAISNEGNGAYSYITLGICPYPTYTTNPVLSQGFSITNTAMVTSASGQKVKATSALTLETRNIELPCTFTISAPNITFYDNTGAEVTELESSAASEQFELHFAYKPTAENTMEYPTITITDDELKTYTIKNRISARSLPATFAIVAKVGNLWYALPSQGLNSTDALVGYPVEVDNQDDPTAVTAVPENADWSLRQVYASSEPNDRFTANGDNLVFVNNASPAMTLNASTSDNYLLANVQYANYYQPTPGLYEWTPTTTDLETYQLTNEQRGRTLSVNTATVFGVHAQNKAVEQVRFLPIQDRYTPAALQVVEWKENSVVIMYNGDPAQTASVSVNGAEAQETVLSSAQRDIAVYELAATGLATNPTQRLSITIGSEKVILPIPYIVGGDLDDATLLGGNELTIARRQEIAKISDLVILNGGSVTAERISTNYYKFRNVTIYGGGSLVIPSDKGFGANSLTMRVGGVEAGEYVYTYPQLDLNGTINSGNINLDLMTTYDYYYPFSVPYEVTLTDIHYPIEIYGSNVKPDNKGSFLVSNYDGEARAQGNTGWKDVEEQGKTVLSPHVGYSIWGLPKKVSVNGATSVRQTYGIHRIPMKKAADVVMSNETTNKNVDIFAHNATRDNDKGWNFIGNPYLVQHGGLDGSDADVYMGLLVKEMKNDQWTGGWVFNGEQVRYVTQTNDCLNYTSTPVADATIPAFSAFFIQAKVTGAIAFTSPNVAAAQSLTARRSDENKEINTGIILSGEKHSDRTGLLIADEFTEAYEFNADLSKFDNQDMNLYTISPSGKLAFMAINEELAKQTIPLGYSVSADGMYTIAFDEQRYNRDDIYALYLIDYDRNEITNLLHMDYDFYSDSGASAERFALQVAFAPSTTTDVEYTQVGDILVSREGNTLRLDNLPSDATVTIYDAVGHLIEQRIAPQLLQLTLQKGYYLIHIGSNQNSVVIDTFIP